MKNQKIKIRLPRAECKVCDHIIQSNFPGDRQVCECGRTFVDCNKEDPQRVRYGSSAKIQTDKLDEKGKYLATEWEIEIGEGGKIVN